MKQENTSSEPETLNSLFTFPLTDLSECATGHHTWQATKTGGIALCLVCGMVGYCLYCIGGDIPPGSPLRACRLHRHSPAKLVDSSRPFSAFTRGDTTR